MRGTTFEITRFFTWAVLALFLVLPGMACGGGASNSTGSDKSSETTKVPPDEGEGDPLGPSAEKGKGDQGKGWRWKGKRDHCYYVFENQCFEDKKSACAAAGCDTPGCRADDGAPAKVSCAK